MPVHTLTPPPDDGPLPDAARPLTDWLPAAGPPARLADGGLQLLDCRDAWPTDGPVPPLQEHLLAVALHPLGPVQATLPGQPPRTADWPEGAVLLLPAGMTACVHLPARHHLLLLALRPALLYGGARRPTPLRAGAGTPDGLLLALARALRAAAATPGAPGDVGHHLVQALAAHLCAHHAQAPRAERPGLSRQRLDRVLAHLHERLDQPIDLSQAARIAGCSVSHFAHLFKAAMGVSPMRYLRERRMVHARELVETTALPIGEIGLRVGIPEPAQFSQAFRAHWRTPPSQLRRRP